MWAWYTRAHARTHARVGPRVSYISAWSMALLKTFLYLFRRWISEHVSSFSATTPRPQSFCRCAPQHFGKNHKLAFLKSTVYKTGLSGCVRQQLQKKKKKKKKKKDRKVASSPTKRAQMFGKKTLKPSTTLCSTVHWTKNPSGIDIQPILHCTSFFF